MTDRIASSTTDSRPILAAVDGSTAAYHAAAWAAMEAALHGRRLHLLTSVMLQTGFGPAPVLGGTNRDWFDIQGERVLTEAVRVVRAAVSDALDISTEITEAPVIPELLTRSSAVRMVVVGSRGLGAFGRALLGSVSSALIYHANCPVAVIHGSPATDPVLAGRPVLVGVDGGPNSMPAIEMALEEASLRKVGLVALHAWSDTSGLHRTEEALEAIREQEEARLADHLAGYAERCADVAVTRMLMHDNPVRSLVEAAENAQLLVVGSRGRGGFAGMLLGSTSAAVAQSVECPIVVVRGAV
ncbi:universal stress protein [Nocardia pseudobrasiliensis]|uniref:Nucleotide-binding universal stress UspA family protein n=1 Tax=Nocardia pseudobrasiliensis TaxID=45979 RepID=A0A370IC69_9NOCA|nr:universal stress protein [Nocardia pseudobrasiliensis]RDI68293.1 nucleotide-binding universal stress UspA family protein [Nocardia pseudobrasiliensis]